MEPSITITGIDEVLLRLKDLQSFEMQRRGLNLGMRRAGEFLKRLMQHKAPVDTGKLADSITVTTRETTAAEAVVRVGPSGKLAWRAKFVEFGTKAHQIRTKHAFALADIETGTVFGRIVNHPGGRQRAFVRPTFDEGEDQAREIAAASIIDFIEEQAG